ncbi:hypothetical protein [Rhizobium straminoryzae]|uniref:Transcriptional regulator n=1 Tax=Rhizobium straminoryzae TaxID=1387186 RepID=A0A549T0X0_9HYPH|nr:hypothetical protein [Rhizobium straminoryzae]TRL35519.1 hypothetical protein FNA46_20180 [Rhizobium straminoryzae]
MTTRHRNVPLELAQIQRERGEALTRADFRSLGYSESELSDANINEAAALFAAMAERAAA